MQSSGHERGWWLRLLHQGLLLLLLHGRLSDGWLPRLHGLLLRHGRLLHGQLLLYHSLLLYHDLCFHGRLLGGVLLLRHAW